jgi:hypothetical protein
MTATRHRFRFLSTAFVVASVLFTAAALAAFAADVNPPTTREEAVKFDPAATTQPSPDLTPDQVVQVQMEAMKHNDRPARDVGIAKVFKFASPGNREQTGPLEKFTAMVKNPVYGPMLNCKSVRYGPVEIDNGQAHQLVKVTDAGGQEAWYIFILSKQTDAPYKDCWMTDGVIRVEPKADEHTDPAIPVYAPGRNGNGNGKHVA